MKKVSGTPVHTGCPVVLVDLRPDVRTVGIGDIKTFYVSQCLTVDVQVIYANEPYASVPIVAPGLFQQCCFLLTFYTPGSPEIDNYDITAQVSQ
jgi:hypothetical protein